MIIDWYAFVFKLYEKKQQPEPDSEGQIRVIGFDGKGVPVIKRGSDISGKVREKKKNEGKESPVIRAKNPRRMASLERSEADVMIEIIKDAESRCSDGKGALVAVMDGAFEGEKGYDVSVSFLPFVIENISTFEWQS